MGYAILSKRDSRQNMSALRTALGRGCHLDQWDQISGSEHPQALPNFLDIHGEKVWDWDTRNGGPFLVRGAPTDMP